MSESYGIAIIVNFLIQFCKKINFLARLTIEITFLMSKHFGTLMFFIVGIWANLTAQLTGSLESNVNFYQRDTTLESIEGNPLYENQLGMLS